MIADLLDAAGHSALASVAHRKGLTWARQHRKRLLAVCDSPELRELLKTGEGVTIGNDQPRCSVGMAVMVLPRMELRDIGDWIRHHAALGVREFWIWDDGHQAVDNFFRAEGDGKVWGKKPQADYRLDLTDAEVDVAFREQLTKAADDSGATVHYRRTESLWGNYAYHERVSIRQGIAFAESIREARESCDWLAFLDGDEWLQGDLWHLNAESGDCVRLIQRVMDCRWSQQNVPQITKSWGFATDNSKVIVRTTTPPNPWPNPHTPDWSQPKNWTRNRIATSKLHYLHFVGNAGLPDQYKTMRGRGWHYDRITAGQNVEHYDNHAKPLGGLILGCPRSGTSLFTTLLNSTGRYHAIGESHVDYKGDIYEIAANVRQRVECRRADSCRLPIVDKLLEVDQLREHQNLIDIAPLRWVILRHPLAIMASIRRLGWHITAESILERLKAIRDFVELAPPNTMVLSYYELTQPKTVRRMFGADPDQLPAPEVPYSDQWGDAFTQSRRLRPVTEREDIEQVTPRSGKNLPAAVNDAVEVYHELKCGVASSLQIVVPNS